MIYFIGVINLILVSIFKQKQDQKKN